MNFSAKFLLSVFFVVALSQLVQSQTNCPTECLHLGTVNTASCSCDCFPAWEGTYCEKAKGNCSASDQPSDCGSSFTSDFCIFETIDIYCPRLCSHPACTCGIDECLNGGFFDDATCECFCPYGFFGTVCEYSSQCPVILDCIGGVFSADTCDCVYSTTSTVSTASTTAAASTVSTASTTTAASTVSTASTTTAASTVSTASTTTAASTASTTTAASTASTASTTAGTGTTSLVTSCQPLSCQNGHIFNTNTCSCPCGNGFSGTLCETYDCSLSPTVDSALNGLCDTVLTCDTASSQCPFKCLCGGSTGAPTTSGTTVSPTTSVVTSCQPLSCQNGHVFNTNTCSCPCGNGFSGTLCETYNCNLSPTVDSALNGLCDTVLTCPDAASQCPFKCLCGGTTAA